jgi:16S rRNA (guanine(527)-N(7))-methyltransferase RsmG
VTVFSDILKQRIPSGCVLSDVQIGRLVAHYELMLHWNRRVNLTRISAPVEAAVKHYAECLFLGQCLPSNARRIVDIGSGAGFPGFVLAVGWPRLEVTLVESDRRKAVFLREASHGMSNVRVEALRCEQLSGRWDCLVSRAVAWRHLEKVAPRLARFAALLTSQQEAEAVLKSRVYSWAAPQPVAGTRERIVLVGEVPRET